MPSPRVHAGQGFQHRHAVIDSIDVAIYFGIVSIKGSKNITYGCIWEVELFSCKIGKLIKICSKGFCKDSNSDEKKKTTKTRKV